MEWPVKVGDVLEWLRSSPINQAIVVGGVVLLLVVVILLIRSRKARARKRPVVEALGRLDGRTQEVLELYRVSHPAFYRIVDEYRQQQVLDHLLTDPDFAAAFEKLKTLKSKAERQSRDKRVSALQITAAGDRESVSRETRAAMLTILRVLYLNRDFTTELTPQADADLDRLLESLTD
jgi:hypothetical protein